MKDNQKSKVFLIGLNVCTKSSAEETHLLPNFKLETAPLSSQTVRFLKFTKHNEGAGVRAVSLAFSSQSQ